MKNFFYSLIGVLLLLSSLVCTSKISAQDLVTSSKDLYFKAEVLEILKEGVQKEFGMENPFQTVTVKCIDGDFAGKTLTIEHGKGYSLDVNQLVKKGQHVVVAQAIGDKGVASYQIIDVYRLDQVAGFAVLFFVGIVVLSGWKGIGAISGMLLSLGVIVVYIVPQILAGKNPVSVSIVGSLLIMLVTMYLAHGYSKKTNVALFCTFITLIGSAVIATLLVKLTYLTGLGTEDAYALKLGATSHINVKGLLLGGIIIGALGVLDDVTTGLAASVQELSKANSELGFYELLQSGMEIGKEHITSLVNTLVLAYAGAALPIFLILILNPNHVPLWVILNSEMIIEEIVRTLSGSIGLVAAVPITAVVSALVFGNASGHES